VFLLWGGLKIVPNVKSIRHDFETRKCGSTLLKYLYYPSFSYRMYERRASCLCSSRSTTEPKCSKSPRPLIFSQGQAACLQAELLLASPVTGTKAMTCVSSTKIHQSVANTTKLAWSKEVNSSPLQWILAVMCFTALNNYKIFLK
jgi:hypothetical protein